MKQWMQAPYKFGLKYHVTLWPILILKDFHNIQLLLNYVLWTICTLSNVRHIKPRYKTMDTGTLQTWD